MKRLLPFVIVLITSLRVLAGDGLSTQTFSQTKPLAFIENKGQVTDQHYKSRSDIDFKLEASGGLNIFIGNGAIHYQFSKPLGNTHFPIEKSSWLREEDDQHRAIEFEMYRMDVELLGANRDAKIIHEGRLDYYENYYTAGTGENGVTVHVFNKVTYKEIYPHIDWVLYVRNGKLKHEFVVRQGGNVSDIQLKYGGATELKINETGSLTAKTPQGVVIEDAPVSFINEHEIVKSSFQLNGNVLSYKVDRYFGTLTIDPTLDWGTYFGGSNSDVISSFSTNDSAVHYAGMTGSNNIATTGAFQTIHGGFIDAFLAKMTSSGSAYWITYYGNTGWDDIADIEADSFGDIYAVGYTSSTASMSTSGAHQTTPGSNQANADGFLAKFNMFGLRQWSTYYGGTQFEELKSVSLDNTGKIYVSGYTHSSNGISTPGAHQPLFANGSFGSNADGFLVKFDNNGTRIWGTYYGGLETDYINAIEVDDTCVYIVGHTKSSTSVATANVHKSTLGGDFDGFIVKFDSAGNRKWGTYYGGTRIDDIRDIAMDSLANIYISGSTESNTLNSIATPGSHKPTYTGMQVGTKDAFLAKFSNNGTRLWGTYYGGSSNDYGLGVSLDNYGYAYLCGTTMSTTNIATSGVHQPTINGANDVFIVKFDNNGSRIWGTYYGGTANDDLWGFGVNSGNGIYVCGATGSTSNISTAGAYQITLGGDNDGFIAVFCDTAPILGTITGSSIVCLGEEVSLGNSTYGGTWFSINGNSNISSKGEVTGVAQGTDTLMYVKTNACGSDTAYHTIDILPVPQITIQPVDVANSAGGVVHFSVIANGVNLNYQWQTNFGSSYQNITDGGQYSGTNTAVLTVSGTTLANNSSKFRCIVTSNTCEVISDTAILFVWPLSISSVKNEDIHIAPNPTKNIITVTSSNTIRKIELLNLLGQRMILQDGNSKTLPLSLNNLASGMYIIKVNDSYVERVVKE